MSNVFMLSKHRPVAAVARDGLRARQVCPTQPELASFPTAAPSSPGDGRDERPRAFSLS
jgi:hypothetical protein